MFKNLFGKKRSFRKMLTPVAAVVMLAQPASYVQAALPANCQVTEDHKIVSEGTVYYSYTLNEFCEMTGMKNRETPMEKLTYLREISDGFEDKFQVFWNEKCYVFRKLEVGGGTFGTSDKDNLPVCVTLNPEDFVALETELGNPGDVLNLPENASNEQREFVSKVNEIKENQKEAEEAKKKAEEEAGPKVEAEAVAVVPKGVEAEKEELVVVGAPDVKKEKDEKANNRLLNTLKWITLVGIGGVGTKVIYDSVTGEVNDEYEVDEDGNLIYSKTEEVNQNDDEYETDEESYEEYDY